MDLIKPGDSLGKIRDRINATLVPLSGPDELSAAAIPPEVVIVHMYIDGVLRQVAEDVGGEFVSADGRRWRMGGGTGGEPGPPGPQGASIQSIDATPTGALTVTLTDGTSATTTPLIGDAGISVAAAGQAQLFAEQAQASATAVQASGTFALTGVGGTANALTGTLPSGATVAEGLRVSLQLISNNTGAATLAINGGAAQSIRDADGSNLTANTLKSGRAVTMERRGATWRVISGTVTSADIALLTPIQVTITNLTNAAGRTLANYNTPNTDLVLNPASEGGVIIGVPPTKGNVAVVNTRITVRRRGDAVVMTYYDAVKTFEMVYVGGAWGAWADITPYAPASRQTVNADALGGSARNFNNMIASDTTWTSAGAAIMSNAPPSAANAYITARWQAFDVGPMLEQRVWIAGRPAYSYYSRFYDKAALTFTPWVTPLNPVAVGPILLAFGDSITAGVGVGANDPDGYALRTAALLNSTITRLATAGRCMCGTTAGDLIPTIDLPANAAAIAAAQVIWIAYGTNDWGSNQPIGGEADTTNGTFYGAMREGLTKLRAINPTAKVGFLTPIYRGHAYSNPLDWSEAGTNTLGLHVEHYRNAIRRFAAINALPVSEMSVNSEINDATAPTYLPADALHPNRLGHRYMADALAARLMSWGWT